MGNWKALEEGNREKWQGDGSEYVLEKLRALERGKLAGVDWNRYFGLRGRFCLFEQPKIGIGLGND